MKTTITHQEHDQRNNGPDHGVRSCRLLTSTIGLTFGLLAMAGAPEGAAAHLEIDGIVRVQHGSLEGARLIILRNGAPANLVTDGLGRFNMTLQLQTMYLLSFEREGRVTKQLSFDTSVPEEFLAEGPFSFPFQVTLEAPPQGERFEYAGPVGFIHFEMEMGDFTYDTDLTRKVDPGLALRMAEARSSLETTGMLPVSPMAVPSARLDPRSGRAIAEFFRRLQIQRAGKDGHIADLDISSPDEEWKEEGPDPLVVIAPLMPSAALAMLDRVIPPPVLEVLRTAVIAKVPIAKPMQADAVVDMAVAMASTPAMDDAWRSEEVIANQQYVTIIIRITRNAHTTEYRRVTHHFGAVYFFKDGISCSDLSYAQGTRIGSE